MGKVRLRENWLAQSPQGVLTPTLVLLPAGGDELKRGDQISSRLQSLNVRATSWGRSSLKGFVKPGQVIESSSLEVSVSPTGIESQTSGTFTCMRVTCGYCENAGSGSLGLVYSLMSRISNELPSNDAAGPGLCFEKLGRRSLLMCPFSWNLKRHHQPYWQFFIIGVLKDSSSLCMLLKRLWVVLSFKKKVKIFIMYFTLLNVHNLSPFPKLVVFALETSL